MEDRVIPTSRRNFLGLIAAAPGAATLRADPQTIAAAQYEAMLALIQSAPPSLGLITAIAAARG